jgi:hypothetical protein
LLHLGMLVARRTWGVGSRILWRGGCSRGRGDKWHGLVRGSGRRLEENCANAKAAQKRGDDSAALSYGGRKMPRTLVERAPSIQALDSVRVEAWCGQRQQGASRSCLPRRCCYCCCCQTSWELIPAALHACRGLSRYLQLNLCCRCWWWRSNEPSWQGGWAGHGSCCSRLAAVLDAGERAALDGTSVISASPSAGHADGQSLCGHVARR